MEETPREVAGGTFHREEGEQTEQALCLNLIADCVIACNTGHYQKILNELREEGFPVNEEDLAHLSPTRYGHINPHGRYRFDLPEGEVSHSLSTA